MTEPTASAMQELRASTRDEHDRAEHHAFQQALVRGELPRDRYAAWLGQMYLIHRSLEAALREAARKNEGVASVVKDYQYQLPYLLEDLEFFQVDPEAIDPLPAAERFRAEVESHAADPLYLLGLHYVLEGSNNGGRFIARHVSEAYDLAAGPGLRYLDPYGDRQRQYWLDFRQTVDSLALGADETQRLVAAAKRMYRTVAELADDLSAAS